MKIEIYFLNSKLTTEIEKDIKVYDLLLDLKNYFKMRDTNFILFDSNKKQMKETDIISNKKNSILSFYLIKSNIQIIPQNKNEEKKNKNTNISELIMKCTGARKPLEKKNIPGDRNFSFFDFFNNGNNNNQQIRENQNDSFDRLLNIIQFFQESGIRPGRIQNNTPVEADEKALRELQDMGFAEDRARQALINSGNFQNVFEITKDNCTNPKIINFLYFLLVDILNGPSDLQNFSFLSKAKKIFEEFFDIQNMKKLSLNLPVGLRKRFEKVIEIFKTYETSFTESCDLKTCFNNQTYIKVKCEKNIKKKNNEKKDVRLCETLLSTFNKHIIKRYEEYFGYDIDGIKLFDAYNFYSNEKNDKYFDEHSNNVEYFLENDSSTSFLEYLFSNSTKFISMKYIFKDNNEIKYFIEDLNIFKEYFPYDVHIKIIRIEKIIFVIVSIFLRCDYLHCFLKLENREQKL